MVLNELAYYEKCRGRVFSKQRITLWTDSIVKAEKTKGIIAPNNRQLETYASFRSTMVSPVFFLNALIRATAVRTEEPVANPLTIAEDVCPTASSADIVSKTPLLRSAIVAIFLALSTTEEKELIDAIVAMLEIYPTAAMATPKFDDKALSKEVSISLSVKC